MFTRMLLILCACILDASVGYPAWLYARIKHPVVWIGSWIALFERNFNKPGQHQKIAGVFAVLLTLMVAFAAANVAWYLGWVAELLMMSALIAQRSLYDHVKAVATTTTIEDARTKVSKIVGRDVNTLDEAGVCRATIESLAESFSDGVVAPLFWAAIFGLHGMACYKAINTADSMIGHKDERYKDFGWATAKLDDIMNFIPARLSAAFIALAVWSKHAWKLTLRDAKNHTSPNAGWPETAMAGALGIQLGGNNTYDGELHIGATFGDGTREATRMHIFNALHVYRRACLIVWLTLISAAIL